MSKEDEGMMGEIIDVLWCEFRFVCDGVNYFKYWYVIKLVIIYSWLVGYSKFRIIVGKVRNWVLMLFVIIEFVVFIFLLKKIWYVLFNCYLFDGDLIYWIFYIKYIEN